MKFRLQQGNVRYLRTTYYALSILILMRIDLFGLIGGRLRWVCVPEATKNSIVLRAHPLYASTVRLSVSTHYSAPSFKNDACRCSIDAWEMNFGFSGPTSQFDPFFINAYHTRVSAPTCPSNSWTISRLRKLTTLLAHLFIFYTGVDYAGPIAVRTAPSRGHKSHKVYIALFVCLTTKVLRLELVSDYSSFIFIAAYQRFVSRRGLPRSMYSNNGSTFQDAKRELCDTHARAIRDPNFRNRLATSETA